jgi:hypothetical protein
VTRGWKILILTSIGVYLVSLDVSILNVAFRDLVGDFGRDQERLLAVAMAGIYRDQPRSNSRLPLRATTHHTHSIRSRPVLAERRMKCSR